MKATGIVRKVDELGRIVFPINLRRRFDIKNGDSLEVYVNGDTLIYRKYQPKCVFCGESADVREIKGKDICGKCIERLRNYIE